jgi:CRISPR type III-A-associated protein Csm2
MTQAQGSSAESLPGRGLVSPEEIRRIIVDGDAETLVNSAERMGRRLKEGNVARHQVLGIYGDIWRIEMAWPASPAEAQRGLHMLKPKLASLAKRAKETADGPQTLPVEELKTVMCQAVDVVLEQADEAEEQDTARRQAFERFVSFFEATVAYHRYHGGRD